MSILDILIAEGEINFSDGYVNGVESRVMESNDAATRIIQAFKYAIEEGFNPEDVEQEIYRKLNIDPEDLTWYDKEIILREVNEMIKEKERC